MESLGIIESYLQHGPRIREELCNIDGYGICKRVEIRGPVFAQHMKTLLIPRKSGMNGTENGPLQFPEKEASLVIHGNVTLPRLRYSLHALCVLPILPLDNRDSHSDHILSNGRFHNFCIVSMPSLIESLYHSGTRCLDIPSWLPSGLLHQKFLACTTNIYHCHLLTGTHRMGGLESKLSKPFGDPLRCINTFRVHML